MESSEAVIISSIYCKIIGNVFDPKDVRNPSAIVAGYIDGISSFLFYDC